MSRTLVPKLGTDAGSLILLAYEDPEQSSTLVRWLVREGTNEVLTCPLARAATSLIEDVRPDLILLQAASDADLLIAACEDIRGVTERPVVVLSEISDELAISRALDSGVDDYFVLPITERELVARVRALSRRWHASRVDQPVLTFAGLELSPDEQSVALDGRAVDLTPMEFRLLACLVSAQGNVLTHDYIMANVWGAEYVDSRHYLHLYIRYLRDKLEADSSDPKLIISEWGIGYRLQPAPVGSF